MAPDSGVFRHAVVGVAHFLADMKKPGLLPKGPAFAFNYLRLAFCGFISARIHDERNNPDIFTVIPKYPHI
jgi:hypothetical protein